MSHRCNKCTENNYSCTCKKKCNDKKDNCKPKCDPCNTQEEVLYCGNDVECTGLKKGNTLDESLEDISKIVCGIKTTIVGIGKNLEYNVVGSDGIKVSTEVEGKTTTFTVDTDTTPIEATYEDLEIIIANSGLITGRYYEITDYQNIYDQPEFSNPVSPEVTLDVKIGAITPLRLLANSPNTFTRQAWRSTTPDVYLEYDFSFNSTETMGYPAKGRIVRCIDENGNDTNYDHTEVLFKRYEKVSGSGVYDAYFDTGFGQIEVKTFGNNCYLNKISTGKKEIYTTVLSDFYLSNNTFGDGCLHNKIGDSSANNTFGEDCKYNELGDFSTRHLFRDRCESNNIGAITKQLSFGEDCKNNTVGPNSGPSYFENGCEDNVAGSYFMVNRLGSNSISNTFADGCYNNIMKQDFRHNNFKYKMENIDFTSATLVYEDFNCDIVKTESGTLQLMYVDTGGATVITNITD